ncbi:MAG: hypothetical protein ABL904_22260 [Hyphomicrobiaceae bacterium]
MTEQENGQPLGCARWVIASVAFLMASIALWGSPVTPIFGTHPRYIGPVWDRIYWISLIGVGILIGAYWLGARVLSARKVLLWVLFGPSVLMVLIVSWIWGVAVSELTKAQSIAIARFQPDFYEIKPVRHSIRNALSMSSRESHGSAAKACKTYLWSFREMGFVEISNRLAVDIHVIPEEWRKKCGMPLTVNDLRK